MDKGSALILCYTAYVFERIPDLLASRKVQDSILLGAVALLGVVAFGLGRLSAGEGRTPVALCTGFEQAEAREAQGTPPQVAASVAAVGAVTPPSAARGAVVGSRSGTTYHLPWCSGAQRIKEENKVWFASREAAEAAGYHKAKNCKGL